MPERWLPVPGYEGFYEVSDRGRIKSLARVVRRKNGVTLSIPERILKPVAFRTGHLLVSLARDGEYKQRPVHRLVLQAFVGPCPDGLEACHGDGDPANNRLKNLRWDTRASNIADRLDHGAHQLGERNPQAKLTEADVLAIRADPRPQRKIAADYGVNRTVVSRIKGRKRWAWLPGP
jgi:hypothetical protein